MNATDLLGTLFLARDVAHRVHLSTRSYAKHMALNDFYEGIVGLADDFAETYQGRHGLLSSIPLISTKKSNIVEFLQGQVDEIEKERKNICGDDSPLQNIIDEIVGLYLRTLYKLRFLA